MEIKVETQEDVVIVSLSGEIQGASDTAAFQEKILEYVIQGGYKKIIVDLLAMEWLRKIGADMLTAAQGTIKKNQGKLKLVLAKENRVFLNFLKLIKNFDYYDNVENALASFNKK